MSDATLLIKRMPSDLKQWLVNEAARNARSLNKETIRLLEEARAVREAATRPAKEAVGFARLIRIFPDLFELGQHLWLALPEVFGHRLYRNTVKRIATPSSGLPGTIAARRPGICCLPGFRHHLRGRIQFAKTVQHDVVAFPGVHYQRQFSAARSHVALQGGKQQVAAPFQLRRRWLVVCGGYAAFDSSPPAIMVVVRPDKMIVAP